MKSELKWINGLEFVAEGESGHQLTIDASKKSGGNNKGPRPMELLLHGLAGCTAIDVVLILKKMKVELTDFNIEVDGQRAEEYPKHFTELNLKFIFKGRGLTDKNVTRAIELSKDKYCSASNSFNAAINYTYEIINQEDN